MTKGWNFEPTRHSLASRGVITTDRDHPVFVGGRDHPRFRNFTRGGRTDVSNAFHTTTDPEIAEFFVEEGDTVYKLELDMSEVPDDRIIRAEDWTPEMARDFSLSGMIYFKHLKETRPELVKSLKDRGYNKYLSVEMLSNEKPLDILTYPHIETEYGLNEKEVAIFNRELLLDAWKNREEVKP